MIAGRKQTVYFPLDMLQELESEAKRQGGTIASLVREAWRIASPEIQRLGEKAERAFSNSRGYTSSHHHGTVEDQQYRK